MRLLFLVVLLVPLPGWAQLRLAPLFEDHAILQRDKPVPIWGEASPGTKVTVQFSSQEVQATTQADGRWLVYLDPLNGSSDPQTLTVRTDQEEVVVSDVLVGEIWLCAGQSNMAWPLAESENGAQEAARAEFPLIRHFKVQERVSDTPATSLGGAWVVCSPATAGSFTAVGYHFAREIQRKIGVPVGLVNSTWNGTVIEGWMSPYALGRDPAFAVVHERWRNALSEFPQAQERYEADLEAWKAEEAAARKNPKIVLRPWPAPPYGPGHSHTPSGLFNGMIHPLLPAAIRGILWYQGESNASRAGEYAPLFMALITAWREHFGQGDLPFYWVQLAGFKTAQPESGDWAYLREAQTQALALPETGQAIALDLGDPNDIHPRNKRDVGRRLARIATAEVYDVPGDALSPSFAGAEPEGTALRVRFDNAATGLIARDRPLQSFEIAGADRVFHPARAVIEGETVLVSAPEVKAPVAVRYAWKNYPAANLFSGAGLPAAPFRSDDWPR